jgi:hypothetical protein
MAAPAVILSGWPAGIAADDGGLGAARKNVEG